MRQFVKGGEKLEIVITTLVAALVSTLVSKMMGDYYLCLLDKYAKDLLEISKEQVRKAYLNQDRH